MTDQEEVEIARVTMQWPQDLKERVRGVAGGRAMTKYVIDAVEARLDEQSALDAQRKELWDARYLCQQLADALAMAGDYEDRISVLRTLDLPAWIETSGWSDAAADVVPIEDEPVQATEMGTEAWAAEEAREAAAHQSTFVTPPIANVPPPVVGVGEAEKEVVLDKVLEPGEAVTVSGEPKAGRSHSNDLFQRLREKAAEKGVDVSGIDLKPASEVQVLTDEERAAKGVQSAFRPEPDDADDTVRIETEPEPEPFRPSTAFERPEDNTYVLPADSGITDAGTPPGNVHNHAWSPMEDPHGIYTGPAYVCECGASMDRVKFYAFGEVPEPKEPAVEPTEAPETAANRCSACQEELIDGECWTCM